MHFKPYDGLGVVSSIHSCGQPRDKELHWKHVSNLAVDGRLVESPYRLGGHQESCCVLRMGICLVDPEADQQMRDFERSYWC